MTQIFLMLIMFKKILHHLMVILIHYKKIKKNIFF
jgi:hypothetical protein